MRVLLNGWFWHQPDTGSGQYVRRLVAALAQEAPQIECGILLPGPPDASEAHPPNVTLLPSPARERSGSRVGRALRKLWWEQSVVPRVARRWGADVLHVPYWAPPMRSPVPVVVTVHDLIPMALPAYRRRVDVRLYTSLVSAATPGAAALIADSEATRRDLLDHLHVDPARVRTVHLAADARYYPPDGRDPEAHEADAAVLQDLGVGSGYVLYLGGFDVRKNLAVLFEAFACVRRALAEVLVVAGRLPAADTAFTPDPRRLAREAGVDAGAVRFTGYVPEAAKPALYRGAWAFLFPSRYEGFGLPPLEALACGVPVVGSDTTSLPEVVGDAGVLTAPDDAAGMAGGIIHLLSDEAFHTTLRRRAQRQAARFSWAATAQQTAEVYRESVRI